MASGTTYNGLFLKELVDIALAGTQKLTCRRSPSSRIRASITDVAGDVISVPPVDAKRVGL